MLLKDPAKESGDEKKYKKYRDVAIKLTKLKKKLETELDKALGTLHSDAELELTEGKLREDNLNYSLQYINERKRNIETQIEKIRNGRNSN